MHRYIVGPWFHMLLVGQCSSAEPLCTQQFDCAIGIRACLARSYNVYAPMEQPIRPAVSTYVQTRISSGFSFHELLHTISVNPLLAP